MFKPHNNRARITAAMLAIAGAATFIAPPVLAATTYRVDALEHAIDATFSTAIAISPSGLVVGQSGDYDGQAVLWGPSGNVTHLTAVGGVNAAAVDVNGNGQVLISYSGAPYLWSNGVLAPVSIAGSNPIPASINDAGVIVGTLLNASRAFIWNAGVTTELGTLPAGGSSAAVAVNNSSQVAGWAKNASGQTRAVIWNNGIIRDLGTLPGDTSSIATAINDAGQVVGHSFTATTARAFVWSNGVMSEITGLPGSIKNYATGINSAGMVSGYSAMGTGPETRYAAFVSSNGVASNLNLVLGSNFCSTTGINDVGQISANCGSQAYRLNPVAPGVDVGVQMNTVSSVAAKGSPLKYMLTVTNSGSLAASGVRISDLLPIGMTFVSAVPSQGACSGTTTVACSLGSLASNAAATIELTVIPTISGTLVNAASVAANEVDANGINNTASASVLVKAAQDTVDLAVSMSAGPSPATVATNLTYTIVVRNDGVGSASAVSMWDSLPADVTFVAASASQGSCVGITMITCNLGTLASAAQATVTIVIQPRSVGVYNNSVSVGTATADINPQNNSASISVTANTTPAATADLALTMSGSPNPVRVGANLTYAISVSNKGSQSGSAVLVTDTLSPFVSYLSASSSQGSCLATPTEIRDPGSSFSRPTTRVVCTLGTLAKGATATVAIVVTPKLVGTISNTAGVTASSYDANTVNNAAIISTRVR